MPRHCFFDPKRPCTLDCQAAYEREADVPGCYLVWSASKLGWLADEVRENVDAPRSGVWSLFFRETIEIALGEEVRRRLAPESYDALKDIIAAVREQIADELGLVLPAVRVEDNFALEPSGYEILLRGNLVAEGHLSLDRLLCINPDDGKVELPGRHVTDPAYGYPARWIEEGRRVEAEDLGYHVLDPLAVVQNHFYVTCTELAGEILSLEDVRKLLDRATEYFPELVSYAVPKVLSEAELLPILQRLLAEDVPINSLDVILQTILVHIGRTRDPVDLTEQVRTALGRSLTARLDERYRHAEQIPALTLDAGLEDELRGALSLNGHATGIVLPDERREQVLAAIEDAVQRTEFRPAAGRAIPPVLLSAPDLRPFVFDLIHQRLPHVAVVRREEIADALALEVVDTVEVLG